MSFFKNEKNIVFLLLVLLMVFIHIQNRCNSAARIRMENEISQLKYAFIALTSYENSETLQDILRQGDSKNEAWRNRIDQHFQKHFTKVYNLRTLYPDVESLKKEVRMLRAVQDKILGSAGNELNVYNFFDSPIKVLPQNSISFTNDLPNGASPPEYLMLGQCIAGGTSKIFVKFSAMEKTLPPGSKIVAASVKFVYAPPGHPIDRSEGLLDKIKLYVSEEGKAIPKRSAETLLAQGKLKRAFPEDTETLILDPKGLDWLMDVMVLGKKKSQGWVLELNDAHSEASCVNFYDYRYSDGNYRPSLEVYYVSNKLVP